MDVRNTNLCGDKDHSSRYSVGRFQRSASGSVSNNNTSGERSEISPLMSVSTGASESDHSRSGFSQRRPYSGNYRGRGRRQPDAAEYGTSVIRGSSNNYTRSSSNRSGGRTYHCSGVRLSDDVVHQMNISTSNRFITMIAAGSEELIRFVNYFGPCNEHQVRDRDRNMLWVILANMEPFENFKSKFFDIVNGKFAERSFTSDDTDTINLRIRLGITYLRNNWFDFKREYSVSELEHVLAGDVGYEPKSPKYYSPPTEAEIKRGIYHKFGTQGLTTCFHALKSCQEKEALMDALMLNDFDVDDQIELDQIVLTLDMGLSVNQRMGERMLALYYDSSTTQFLKAKFITKECNLNIVTGKRMDYSGDWSDVFDFRVQSQVNSRESETIGESTGYNMDDFVDMLKWADDETDTLLLDTSRLKEKHFVTSAKRNHKILVMHIADKGLHGDLPKCFARINDAILYSPDDMYFTVGKSEAVNKLKMKEKIDTILSGRVNEVAKEHLVGSRSKYFVEYLWSMAILLGQCAEIAAEK